MSTLGRQCTPAVCLLRCASGNQAGNSCLVLLSLLAAMFCVCFVVELQNQEDEQRSGNLNGASQRALVISTKTNSVMSDQRELGNHSLTASHLILYDLEANGRDVRVVTKHGRRHVTCTFTANRSSYNDSLAAVFHDNTPLDQFPKYRAQHQIWVMRTMETPLNTVISAVKRIRLKQSRTFFNITSTYASHSDVPTPYYDGQCHDLTENQTVATPDESDKTIAKLVEGKSRPVAWFVSHCWTSSKRESYVSQLRRYIDVDVYGKCGNYRCGIVNNDDPARCLDMLEKRYFFYLSFENSLCVEYITEKFWRLLHRDVIAVVLGAANYSNLVPPSTYMDVRDFRSPLQLALRMRELMADGGALYKRMLSRKRKVKCTGTADHGGNAFARRLCEYLDETRGQRRVTNLDDTWNAKKMCSASKLFYRGVADSIAN